MRPLREVRTLSSISSRLKVDPGKLIAGLRREDVESNKSIADFLEANYPHAFIDDEENEIATDVAEESTDLEDADADDDNKRVSRPKQKYDRNIRPIKTYVRRRDEEYGSRDCRVMRTYFSMIPGILYGSDPAVGVSSHNRDSKTLIKTPLGELQRETDMYHRSFESRVYDLTVYEDKYDTVGKIHRVTPRDLQRHPIHDTVFYCANFCRYHPGRPLSIPIVNINVEESAALKRDGFIVQINRYVECLVDDGVDIPERIELECTGLGYRDVIRTDRLILPDGVRFSENVQKKGKEFIVGVVFGKSRGSLKDEEAEAVAEPQPKKKKEKVEKED